MRLLRLCLSQPDPARGALPRNEASAPARACASRERRRRPSGLRGAHRAPRAARSGATSSVGEEARGAQGQEAVMTRFATQAAPHVVAPNSVARVMRLVLCALAPTVMLHTVFFGPGLIVQVLLGAGAALAAEALALRLRGKPLAPFLTDGSALVTAA